MANESKKPRKPRTDRNAERRNVVTFCKMSIQILGMLEPISEYQKGKIAGYQDVLKQMDELGDAKPTPSPERKPLKTGDGVIPF